jgi:hypothetical protein
MDDDTPSAPVLLLPVKPRDNDTERVLTAVYGGKCWHKRFIIDDKLEYVECRDCKEKLNPMFVLNALAQKEHRYHELHARYHDELARLAARSRTTCQHCGKITRISNS